MSQRRQAVVRAAGEQAGADQDLEPVADAQDQPAPCVQAVQRVLEGDAQPRGEDPAGSQVVAVGEPAGDGQDLEAIERPRRLEEAADVPGLDVGTRQLPGRRRFLIAVRSRCSQDDRAGTYHDQKLLSFGEKEAPLGKSTSAR
ncbi:MAG: hypothetical protein JO329_13550 [Planctomycetaceae bacterium]|nr:hypothetical protein [Planctomycetaceae bacterium]